LGVLEGFGACFANGTTCCRSFPLASVELSSEPWVLASLFLSDSLFIALPSVVFLNQISFQVKGEREYVECRSVKNVNAKTAYVTYSL